MHRSLIRIGAAFMCAAPLVASAQSTPAPASLLGQMHWRSIGPAVSGGRLGAVAGTDADPYLYYAGAAGGGVWKSTNAGQSWQPVFDDQAVSSVGAIAIDPQDERNVWVGTGEGNPRNDVSQGDGVYHTIDGGKTWRHVLTLRDALITKVIVDPRDSANVLVGVLGDAFADNADRGVYRTTDGGKTWKKTLYAGEQTGVSDMVSSAKTPDVVYAGMWQYRRTAWSSQSGGPHDGLYKSTDGGATWQQLSGNGLPSGELGRIGLAIAPSDSNRVYALIETKDGLLWRSDDDGATWQKTSSNTLINERPFYYSHVFVDPTNADHLWTTSVHLTVSTDGGKTFRVTGRGIHGDHHAMWIAQDGKRIIEGNDGGAAFSQDGGRTWAWDNIIPIGQLYHIGMDRNVPYDVCAPLQDNGVWCAPENGLGRGISASQWRNMGGGDGTWAIPDPADTHYVWTASGGGNFAGDLSILDTRSGESRSVTPYLHDQNVVDPKDLKYRFNWETPIAFDPFDPHHAYLAGNVLFETHDRGTHWRVASPDLTRDLKAHEVVSGGITLDGTGAETTETILYVEPSSAARGEIWIGTDDGYLQLTRDGGKHWRNVTPPAIRDTTGAAGLGRFAILSASKHDARTLAATYDVHMVGDRTPHIYLTHDFGAHWADVANGLPADQEVRSVRLDPRNPQMIYAGLENSIWVTFDGGSHWRNLNGDLPATSIRDIAVQPDANDLIVATHGRSMWILDDLAPLQQLDRARSAGAYLFPVRPVNQWYTHSFWNTHTDGASPPSGAIVTYWLGKAAAHNPTGEIRDASGHVVRTLASHQINGRQEFDLTNQAGLNRFTWDLAEAPPEDWKFTPGWNQGYGAGADVLPGTYTLTLHVDGRTFTQPIVVHQDPRSHYTLAQLRQHQQQQQALYADFTHVDVALNMLSTVMNEAPLRAAQLTSSGNTALAADVTRTAAQAKALLLSITQNPVNDQDNDFLTDVLRERLQTQIDSFGGTLGPPTVAQVEETAMLHALTQTRLAAVQAFERGALNTVDGQLKGANLAPLTTLTKMPAIYNPNGGGPGGGEERRGGDEDT